MSVASLTLRLSLVISTNSNMIQKAKGKENEKFVWPHVELLRETTAFRRLPLFLGASEMNSSIDIFEQVQLQRQQISSFYSTIFHENDEFEAVFIFESNEGFLIRSAGFQ